MAESLRKGRTGEAAPVAHPGRSRHERAGDFLALLGLGFLAPPALAAFGATAPAEFARKAFGAFGESGILLLGFAAGFGAEYRNPEVEAAVGRRARVMHGVKGSSGHAWAEAWVGKGAEAVAILGAVARAAGRRALPLATTLDRASGEFWLVLDWELGKYSFAGDRLEVAWESGR